MGVTAILKNVEFKVFATNIKMKTSKEDFIGNI